MSLVIFHIHLFLIYLCLFCFIIFSVLLFHFEENVSLYFLFKYLKTLILKSSFQTVLLFFIYSNRIYLMILAVVFLGIVFLDASWTFGLPALQMLVLFLFSLLCGLASHSPVVWRLLSPRAEPVYLKEAIGEKAVQSLSGMACFKQFPFMRVSSLSRSVRVQKPYSQATIKKQKFWIIF